MSFISEKENKFSGLTMRVKYNEFLVPNVEISFYLLRKIVDTML